MIENDHKKTLRDRLNYLIKEMNFRSIRAAARDLGIPNSTLITIMQRNALSRTTLRLICNTWKVEPEWLEFGNGPIFKDNYKNSALVIGLTDALDEMIKYDHIVTYPFDTLLKRIRMLQKVLDIESLEQLAAITGIDSKVVYRTLEKNELDQETAQILAKTFGVETLWLRKGRGPIQRIGSEIVGILGSPNTEDEHLNKVVASIIDGQSGDFIIVPKANNKLATGERIVVEIDISATNQAFHRGRLGTLVTEIGNALLVQVEGDSMVPTLFNRDIVMLDLGQCKLTNEDLYGIKIGGVLKISRLAPLPDQQARVTSDNPTFHSYTTDLDDIHIVGRVVWFERVLVR